MSLAFKRSFLVKFHLILSGLIFPIILMFFITGALQTADISTSSKTLKWRSTLAVPLSNDLNDLKQIARTELAGRGLDVPNGKARVKRDKKRASFRLSWRGVNHDLSMRPSGSDPSIAVISVRMPGWYSRFWRLHQAGGNDWFDIFVIVQSVLLLTLVLVGIIIGYQVKLYRRTLLVSLLGGFVVFAGFVFMSQY